MQGLQHDGRAAGEKLRDLARLGRPGERIRPPRDLLRVLAERDLPAFLDDAEAGVAKSA
jgi:hypothetical protein